MTHFSPPSNDQARSETNHHLSIQLFTGSCSPKFGLNKVSQNVEGTSQKIMLCMTSLRSKQGPQRRTSQSLRNSALGLITANKCARDTKPSNQSVYSKLLGGCTYATMVVVKINLLHHSATGCGRQPRNKILVPAMQLLGLGYIRKMIIQLCAVKIPSLTRCP